jgi:hypothetical protein
MKTKALEDLIEHCKHIGGIPAMFLKELIIEAEAELKAINPHDAASTLCAICGRPEYSHSPKGHDYRAKGA